MKHTEAFLDNFETRKTEEDSFALGLELMFLALADLLLDDDNMEVAA